MIPAYGYEDRYSVDRHGNCYSIYRNGRAMKKVHHSLGYDRFHLVKETNIHVWEYVHRIIYQSFHGSIPEGHEINHIDGNKKNNCIRNLEAVTHKENMAHAVKLWGEWRGKKYREEVS